MSSKTIRVWNGATVLQVITVTEGGSSSMIGATGGAHHASQVDVEIDPFAGLIHTHEAPGAPIYYATVQARDE